MSFQNECYLSNLNVSYDKAIVIKTISKLLTKVVSESGEYFIRRYTKVDENSAEVKFLGLNSKKAIKIIEATFPFAFAYYNKAYWDWKLDHKRTGIPSIIVDITNYVNV